jgi:cell division protein FtsQ
MPQKQYEDEFASRSSGESASVELDPEGNGLDPIDENVLDLETEQESPFLRAQKRVPVRRGALKKKTVNRLKYGFVAVAVLAILGVCGGFLYRYGRTSPLFLLESSDSIQIEGNQNVTRAQAMDAFDQDISRNVFLIPLEERKRQLEQLPWVESATVMRLLPNRLRVVIRERTPVAFVQVGSQILLADANGVLLDVPLEGPQKYSFPVITGMAGDEPPSMRAASLRIYTNLLRDLDSEGVNYSRDIDEVDLSDPQDVKITVTDPQGQVLIHLGSSSFLERYKVYQAHAQEWRQHFQKLESIDLRYDRQVIVNPDTKPADTAEQTPETQAAANAAEGGASAPSQAPAAAVPAAKKPAAGKKKAPAKPAAAADRKPPAKRKTKSSF